MRARQTRSGGRLGGPLRRLTRQPGQERRRGKAGIGRAASRSSPSCSSAAVEQPPQVPEVRHERRVVRLEIAQTMLPDLLLLGV